MVRKTSDEVCLQNVERMKELFAKVLPDAKSF